jgi:hypothetical protein
MTHAMNMKRPTIQKNPVRRGCNWGLWQTGSIQVPKK